MSQRLFILFFSCLFITWVRAQNPIGSEQIKFRNYAVKDQNLTLSIENWLESAALSRKERINTVFENLGKTNVSSKLAFDIADLYLGKNVDEINKKLYHVFTTKDYDTRVDYSLEDSWNLVLTKQLYYLYYWFGSKSSRFPGRITAELEKAVLDLLWDRMVYKNDINIAHQSTWWMTGSENHDIVAKVCSFISSQIFMHEPDFRERIYPDDGSGAGYGFWFHGMYGGALYKGPSGQGSKNIKGNYTASDHFKAWTKFFDKFFTERAKRGFFLENASTGYMAVSITYLLDIYNFSENKALKVKAGKFQDLIWCEWVQDALYGVKGGSRTRGDFNVWNDAMYNMSTFYFGGNYDVGGKGSGNGNFISLLYSDYQIPAIVWEMAFDRERMGEFVYISRKPGAEEGTLPRPKGLERTMLCDTESKFVHYSYVTPEYILGSQMDDPLAIHSHLSPYQHNGLIFRGTAGERICPEGGYRQNVQYKRVLITQQARRWMQVNPEWFPAVPFYEKEICVYFQGNFGNKVEKNGWIFVEMGNAFGAVKIIQGKFSNEPFQLNVNGSDDALFIDPIDDDAYSWEDYQKSKIILKNKFSAIIIEASDIYRHSSFDAFMKDILDNPLKLQRTVVPGYYILHYTGCGNDAKEIVFNMATTEIPTVGGEWINYTPDKVLDSPFIQSKYGTGKVYVQKDNRQLLLEFR